MKMMTVIFTIFTGAILHAGDCNLNGTYGYQLLDSNFAATTITLTLTQNKAEFKMPNGEIRATDFFVSEGAQAEFQQILQSAGKSIPANWTLCKASLDVKGDGQALPVTIVKEDSSGSVTLSFYTINEGRPFPIINRAEKSK